MEDDIFSKEQIEQIKKARNKINADLGLDKYDDKKDAKTLTDKIRETSKARSGGSGGGLKPDTDVTASKKLPKMAKGGSVKSSASKRADGCAQRGKTRGKMV